MRGFMEIVFGFVHCFVLSPFCFNGFFFESLMEKPLARGVSIEKSRGLESHFCSKFNGLKLSTVFSRKQLNQLSIAKH
jgi:hypothetical protein